MTLERGERRQERLGNVWITFEGASGAEYDVTDGQLLRMIQRREEITVGTRVRVAHYDDTGVWHEIRKILAVVPNGQAFAGAVA
jgi:hypothetical protein